MIDKTKNYKIRVKDEEESTKVQNKLFELGYSWYSKDTSIQYESYSFLYFGKDMGITHGDEKDFFNKHSNIEITVKELLGNKKLKPKKPTHIVVWDETCGDPCKFFPNEKEAKEFIKELSEIDKVIKDSIILVEIKQSKKVKIAKRLTFSEYKT